MWVNGSFYKAYRGTAACWLGNVLCSDCLWRPLDLEITLRFFFWLALCGMRVVVKRWWGRVRRGLRPAGSHWKGYRYSQYHHSSPAKVSLSTIDLGNIGLSLHNNFVKRTLAPVWSSQMNLSRSNVQRQYCFNIFKQFLQPLPAQMENSCSTSFSLSITITIFFPSFPSPHNHLYSARPRN